MEAINLSHENPGAQTIIITTLPLNSCVLDASVELFVTLQKHGHPCPAKGAVHISTGIQQLFQPDSDTLEECASS